MSKIKTAFLFFFLALCGHFYAMEESEDNKRIEAFGGQTDIVSWYNRSISGICDADDNPPNTFLMQRSAKVIKEKADPQERARALWNFIYRDNQRLFNKKSSSEKTEYVRLIMNYSREPFVKNNLSEPEKEVIFWQFLSIALVMSEQFSDQDYKSYLNRKLSYQVSLSTIFSKMGKYIRASSGVLIFPGTVCSGESAADTFLTNYSQKLQWSSNRCVCPFSMEGFRKKRWVN